MFQRKYNENFYQATTDCLVEGEGILHWMNSSLFLIIFLLFFFLPAYASSVSAHPNNLTHFK